MGQANVVEGSSWVVTGRVHECKGTAVTREGDIGGAALTVHSEFGPNRRLEVHRFMCWGAIGRDVLGKLKAGDVVEVSGFLGSRLSGTFLFPKTTVDLRVRKVRRILPTGEYEVLSEAGVRP